MLTQIDNAVLLEDLQRNQILRGVHHEKTVDSRRFSASEHDRDMMYAWSIGTTEAATELPQNHRREECVPPPPEVFIG